jgi:hypothetical protein
LSNKDLTDKTVYLALYNEIFLNGQKDIGDGRKVAIFDINRFYAALGYKFNSKIKVQAGMMRQSTNSSNKNQLQISLHQKF